MTECTTAVHAASATIKNAEYFVYLCPTPGSGPKGEPGVKALGHRYHELLSFTRVLSTLLLALGVRLSCFQVRGLLGDKWLVGASGRRVAGIE